MDRSRRAPLLLLILPNIFGIKHFLSTDRDSRGPPPRSLTIGVRWMCLILLWLPSWMSPSGSARGGRLHPCRAVDWPLCCISFPAPVLVGFHGILKHFHLSWMQTSVGVRSVGKMPGASLVAAQTAVQPTTSGFVQGAPSCSKPRTRASLRPPTNLQPRSATWRSARTAAARRPLQVVSAGLKDFIGGDLLGFDLNKWVEDVEKYGSIAVYPPGEGGYEGRYCTRLKSEGYHFMNITARGLGDPEAYLTKVHGIRPPHLGKQAVSRYYFPPEVDYRLSLLPENSKGLVLWVLEAKVLSKTELQFLALLPAIRPKVKVIAECGTWRSYKWKPLKDVAGIPATREAPMEASS